MNIRSVAYPSLNRIAQDAYDVADASGWHTIEPDAWGGHRALCGYTPQHLLANLALIHSEVSEALEAVRKDPDHIAEELADVLIRTLELAYMLGIDIGGVTLAKMTKNRARLDVPARSGGKAI
jgi:NTP pyrophosphatase (non-canonical NTP hydrolase)